MRLVTLILATALIALVLPSFASAQATRTWVSGVGDDANPCSRTAPCKTFAGAISKTAASGEIDCLDPGGFGAITITKSMTIDCHHTLGGILAAGVSGVTVSAAATDKVRLIGLDINGAGSGLNGVRVTSAKSVKIYNSTIYNFTRNGVDFEPTNVGARLTVQGSTIEDNTGNGVMMAPPASGVGKGAIRRSELVDNACGVVAASHGPNPSFNYGANCGVLDTTNPLLGRSTINAFHSSFSDNVSTGVFANGSKGTIRIGDNEVLGNTNGLLVDGAGQILSFGNNYVTGNSFDGAPTGPVVPLK